jgi:hypothetical protein
VAEDECDGKRLSIGSSGAKTMQRAEVVTAVRVVGTPTALTIEFEDRELQIPWEKCSTKLARATEIERARIELSPGGYGIHWPLINEDLSIAGLVRAAHGPNR